MQGVANDFNERTEYPHSLLPPIFSMRVLAKLAAVTNDRIQDQMQRTTCKSPSSSKYQNQHNSNNRAYLIAAVYLKAAVSDRAGVENSRMIVC